MPIFVVSLFLPYTVDFQDLPTPARRPSPPPRLPSRNDSIPDINGKASLFPTPTPPRTPAANADPGEFFAQIQPSAATHFIKPHDPRTLVRSDSHVPEWGRGIFFNQPHSRASQLPPSRILGFGPLPEPELPIRSKKKKKKPKCTSPKNASRSRSTERGNWGQQWSIVPAEQGNGGLANAIRAAQRANNIDDIFWLGTVGFPTDSLNEHTKEEIQERLESEYDALTVYVSDSDFDGHYAHYCKTILWPVFHYQIPDHPKSKAYEDHSWKYYVALNQAFADKIVKCYKRGDVIWINDYHLLLVPGMVRKKLPEAQIGFFLHTAFPSSEVFRCLSSRKELLEGMLGANLIAFQSPEYEEHFLTTCCRLLVVEATTDGVQLDDHFVNVKSLAIGIDPIGLDLAREDEAVAEWIKVMTERYKDKKLIVARDKLDHVRGVRQKLLAFELFLNKYPEWRDKVVLIQVATSTTDNPELSATVSDIVTRIDSQFSTLAHQPLVFLRQDIAFSQYLALLSVADVLMVTSLREGMNLTCHEYIICQDGKLCDKKHGPVILSEFTGSASIFKRNEIPVNPWDYQQCADAIKQALTMDDAERTRRYDQLHKIVTTHTGEYWVNGLSKSLAKVHEEHVQRDTMSIPRLSVSQLSEKYRKADLRVFILDYEGTLASFSAPTNIHLSSPQRVLDTLNDLLIDERNIVYIMSGRMPDELEHMFDRVPGLGIIAENGCFVREFNSEEWVSFADLDKMKEWKESVKNILNYYHERIEGSAIEERHCSLKLNYDRAEDLETATRFGGECADQINSACANQKVHAVPVDKAVLVEPIEWSKGSAATHIFDNIRETKSRERGKWPDFLLIAGDDREDEVVFRWANKLATDNVIRDVTTVSVGKRNTEAMATLTQGTSGELTTVPSCLKRPMNLIAVPL
jgi:trehalose 6-phosphate synthase complex regulatory subunit